MLGEWIRKRRREVGLNQTELGSQMVGRNPDGVSQRTISRWENGETAVPEAEYPCLADALDTSEEKVREVAESGGAEANATPDRTRIVASADTEERWVEAVRNSDLDREMKMLLVYLTGQSVLNRQHWVASVDPESLAETVNEDPEWVREKWGGMLETEFVEQLGPGPCTLRLVIPDSNSEQNG